MQIKVTDTRMHKYWHITDLNKPGRTDMGYTERRREVPVVEAKLVLITGGKLRVPDSSEHDRMVTPILISETEKIEVGDIYAMFIDDKWELMEPCHDEREARRCNELSPIKEVCRKVLVLPEHFSPEHLQAIVDGKMKDGDKVLVECAVNDAMSLLDISDNFPLKHPKYIKLNSSNHITLHKVEEKMYTREEMKTLMRMLAFRFHVKREEFDQWFEQNVK